MASDDIFCNDVCTHFHGNGLYHGHDCVRKDRDNNIFAFFRVGENIAQPFNIDRGYTFCCTAADLNKAVDFAPDIDVPLFVQWRNYI